MVIFGQPANSMYSLTTTIKVNRQLLSNICKITAPQMPAMFTSKYMHMYSKKKKSCTPQMKIVEFANRADPDEVAHHDPPHPDLHCLPP